MIFLTRSGEMMAPKTRGTLAADEDTRAARALGLQFRHREATKTTLDSARGLRKRSTN